MTATGTTMQNTMQRLPVLMYHRIDTAHNPWERNYCVSPENFAVQMQRLASKGMQAINMAAFLGWLEGNNDLPDGAFLITFDDGFKGVHDHAAPVLKDLNWPATVFLVSELIGQHDDWCKQENPSGEVYPLMGINEIKALQQQGFSFHSHTRHHPRLTRLDDQALADELAGSRQALSMLLGTNVDILAYPYGDHDARVADAARAAGYRAAFTVQPGFNRRHTDRHRLNRLDVFGTDTPAMLARKIAHGVNVADLKYLVHYYADQLRAKLPRLSR